MKGAIAVSSSLNDRSGTWWVLVPGFVEWSTKRLFCIDASILQIQKDFARFIHTESADSMNITSILKVSSTSLASFFLVILGTSSHNEEGTKVFSQNHL